MSNENVVVWSEIPAIDVERAKAFYERVLKVEMIEDNSGPSPIFIMGKGTQETVSGHVYAGKPATDNNGSTIHFAAPDKLEDALARVEPAGGKIVSPVITIPPGRFAYCTDTEGNSIGIFAFNK